MKYKQIIILAVVIVVAILVFDHGCQGTIQPQISHFPTSVGNWWRYARRFCTVVYDTVNNDTSDYVHIDSLYDEIEAIDTLANWECYRFHETYYPNIRWFAHPETAFLCIASLISSTSLQPPEQRIDLCLVFDGVTFNSLEELAQYLRYKKDVLLLTRNSDTFYWSPPKKIYKYPLRNGISWTAMTDPWIEERQVVAAETIDVEAGTFSTFKIEITSEWMAENDFWYHWISKYGMVKDSMRVRGVAINYQGDTIGYFYSYDTHELVDFNIGFEE